MSEKTTTSEGPGAIGAARPTPAKTNSTTAREHVPDQDVRAWLTVAGGIFLYVAGLGYFNAYGHQFLSPPSGGYNLLTRCADFYVRKFMTERGPSEIAFVSALRSVFLTQGVGLGTGLGLTVLPALGAAAHHFSRRRGLAIGILSSGASIGGIIFPILLNKLLFRHGFATAVRATAALASGLMLLANLLMRPRYPKPNDPGPNPVPKASASMFKILRDPPYVGVVLSGIFVMLGLFYPGCPRAAVALLYAIKHGIREEVAFDTITMINVGGVLGRIVPPFVADRIGCFNVVIPATFAAAGCVLAMLVREPGTGGVVAIALLYGAVNAAYVSMTPALLAELSRDGSEVGLRMGVWFTFTAGAALAGQPLSGALIDGAGDFRWSTLFAGLCLCVGGCLLVVARILPVFYQRQREEEFHNYISLESLLLALASELEALPSFATVRSRILLLDLPPAFVTSRSSPSLIPTTYW
ncbi:major facilitator superfamily domain-containing protein [Mycena pura]|uniref:Major facilitator superfamily domain-containing protein n=1 Tax=Mycena pura TaxID=153505 RepID=A0AAD6VF38_9AGAR|nr:major facilitator superfamily domain-containing protein [Mycena pura]